MTKIAIATLFFACREKIKVSPSVLVLRGCSISWAFGPLELFEPQQLFDGGWMYVCVKNNPNNTNTVL